MNQAPKFCFEHKLFKPYKYISFIKTNFWTVTALSIKSKKHLLQIKMQFKSNWLFFFKLCVWVKPYLEILPEKLRGDNKPESTTAQQNGTHLVLPWPLLHCHFPHRFWHGKQAAEHPWGTRLMEVQGRVLLSTSVLTRFSFLSSDGKTSAKPRKEANTGMESPEPVSLTQMWPSSPWCPVAQGHQALWHQGLHSHPLCGVNSLGQSLLTNLPSSIKFALVFSAATGYFAQFYSHC